MAVVDGRLALVSGIGDETKRGATIADNELVNCFGAHAVNRDDVAVHLATVNGEPGAKARGIEGVEVAAELPRPRKGW